MKDNHRLPLTEPQGKEELSIKCLPVQQPIGTFFIGSIKAQDLVEITHSDVRRIEGERGFETYLGIQRPLNTSRVKKIASYSRTIDACFPTSIILSIDERCAEYDEDTGELILKPYNVDGIEEFGESIPYDHIAKVIDGQHRIDGLKGYDADDFYLNVSIFIGIDVSSEAYIFSTVNLAQTKVNKSLVYDLFDLAEKRSPQKLCHNIAVTLDKTKDSPFHNKIKRLGRAEKHNIPSSITQAAFVESLMKYISSDPLKDRDMYMRGKRIKPAEGRDRDKLFFREFLIQEKDFELTDVIWNYFSAIRDKWSNAWNSEDKGVMLSKTNGFMALMRFLKPCYMHLGKEVPDKKDFMSIISKINMSDDDFVVEKYNPGSSGASQLYKDLVSMSGLSNTNT